MILEVHHNNKMMKSSFNNHDLYNFSSWEDQEEVAFAQDRIRSSSDLIRWPPRSYSCNFCKREFRSAQALGGHMNVHRRDRANLLKHKDHHHDHHQSTLIIPSQPLDHDHIMMISSKSMAPLIRPRTSVAYLSPSRVSSDNLNNTVSGVRKVIITNHDIVHQAKRCKKGDDHHVAIFPFFDVKRRPLLQEPEVLTDLRGKSMESLDLELRLGDPPYNKVK